MSPARSFAAFAAALCVAAALPARADVADDHAGPRAAERPSDARVEREARLRVDRARELYQRGDFAGASENYRAAYRLRPSPGVLFNLAQAYRQDGRCADAARTYRAALATDLDGPARELAVQQLEVSELCVRAVEVSSLRDDRETRRHGAIAIGVGGAALVLAGGLALADHDRRGGETQPFTMGVAVGGGAAVAAGAIVFAVAQRRIHAHQRRVRPEVFRVPVGTGRVAGLSVHF